MDDELGLKLGQISIVDAEKLIIDIKEKEVRYSAEECNRRIFGKVIGDKKLNWLGMKRTMGLLWRMGNALEIREFSNNYFQFLFPNQEALEKVDMGRCWIFENQYLILQPWPSFNDLTVWVQAHGVPINWMSSDVGLKIGMAFMDIKNLMLAKAGFKGSRILRLQVSLDVRKPIPRWTSIRLGEKIVTVQFKYEKLVSLCFYCGILGHMDKNCPIRKEAIAKKDLKDGQYGEWLKATEGVNISESPPPSTTSEPITNKSNERNIKVKSR
ncbi:Unknown protein [Striga hermonthica]|uniref:CCHC-type domain-containing protein n=1 Tax=Striga hermonthica TaxID=68872 RepID=A0A9N7R3L3_STRHE|nr:Unknown protein [Striga hermonthica]